MKIIKRFLFIGFELLHNRKSNTRDLQSDLQRINCVVRVKSKKIGSFYNKIKKTKRNFTKTNNMKLSTIDRKNN